MTIRELQLGILNHSEIVSAWHGPSLFLQGGGGGGGTERGKVGGVNFRLWSHLKGVLGKTPF